MQSETIPNVSERLQHVFANWQALMMMSEVELRSAKMAMIDPMAHGVIERWPTLASYILDHRNHELRPDEWTVMTQRTVKGGFLPYLSFPSQFFQWNRCSRRVFHLPHAMQTVFAAATFPDMTWGDILWPHDSFIITLEKPLATVTPGGVKERFDTIMISKLPGGFGEKPEVVIRVFEKPRRDQVRVAFGFEELKRFRSLARKGHYGKALSYPDRTFQRGKKFYHRLPGTVSTVLSMKLLENEPISVEPAEIYAQGTREEGQTDNILLRSMLNVVPWASVDPEVRHMFDVISAALRIALSWMLYLEAAPAATIKPRTGTTETQRTAGNFQGTAVITRPDHIFEVTGKSFIRAVSSESPAGCETSTFRRPHWRRRHWRRPKGSASDAPRSVQVPTTLIRPDLVPLYGIVGGTTSVVIAD